MDARLASGLEGRYTIDREIGAGGMATVYLARDLRNKRKVALKVLNPELGAVLGAGRFLAEIQVTANLQHPNLLPLFDSGEVDGLLFYTMPFIEGESLRARLDREKQLPVDEAIRIASAIAGALDYAHRQHVIHRDLKPENILMHEGQPLIADFGIALAVSNAGGARVTQTGLSLGTPQYMSPEQATGDRAIDGRTDIYSLGAITYEMLVGDPPHVAGTSQAIIAKLLTERPVNVRTRRPTVPPHADAAVACALEKLAADRFATAGEFARALDGRAPIAARSFEEPAPSTKATRSFGKRELAAWSAATLLLFALGWQLMSRQGSSPEAPVVRMTFDLPAGTRINDVLPGTTIAVGPSGDVIAYTVTAGSSYNLFVRRMNELTPRSLASDVGARNIAFSPDGRWIAFTEGNALKKVPAAGGEVTQLGTTGGAVPYGLAWSETGTIYVGSFSGIYALPENGGRAEPLKTDSAGATGVVGMRFPFVLPGGKTIVFAAGNSSTYTSARASVLDIPSGRIEVYETPMALPLGIIAGHLIFVTPTGELRGARFDGSRIVGDPVQLEEGLLVDPTNGAKASLSASGTLAYVRGRADILPMVISSPSDSGVPLFREAGTYQSPRYSPDGTRVAIALFRTNDTDIWIYDVRRNTFTRLTTEGLNLRPEWTADGRDVVFISARNNQAGIWKQPADGSGPATLLYQPDIEPFEAVPSPDGKWLIYRTSPGATFSRDILAVPLEGNRKPIPMVTSQYSETQPRLSPDGRHLAYQSSESGRFEIYVRPFPGSGARVQVSDGGGTEPVWSRSGNALFYRSPNGRMIRVSVTTGDTFSIGPRSVLFNDDYLTDATHANYDVGPGDRFLMLKRAGAESQTIVVHNWARELREKVSRPPDS